METGKKLVSIIVPVYKVEKYLRTCLDGVLRQTYDNWQMILVDDGSPDECPQICDEYALKDERLTVLHCQNGGQSRARNRALDCPPKGELVTFLDSDDFWHEDYLKTLVGLQQKYDADMVQCGFVRGTEKTFPRQRGDEKVYVLDRHEIFLTEKANVIMWGKLYKTELFDGIRMPVGLYNEDDWTSWKLYNRSKTIVVTSQPLYYYTVNPSSTMTQILKKPDFRYWGAYDERTAYYEGTGEEDLEHCSRLQLCKSLVLTYKNRLLSKEERKQVKDKFVENWRVLCHSPYIHTKYKILFGMFSVFPTQASELAHTVRQH